MDQTTINSINFKIGTVGKFVIYADETTTHSILIASHNKYVFTQSLSVYKHNIISNSIDIEKSKVFNIPHVSIHADFSLTKATDK